MTKKSADRLDSIESDNIQVDPDHRTNNIDEDDDHKFDILFNSQNSINKRNKSDTYTINYRIMKTILLILAWISFGLNFEMIGPTLEDLKIYLNVNYTSISFGLVLRNAGYLGLTLICGFLLDKYSKYCETFMAISSGLIGLSNLLMPITRNYTLSMLYFLVQGLAQAIYDLGGNHLILNLWSGVNTSPINAMHAGYGIGAILAIQFARPFILFDPYHKNVNELNVTLNNSVILNSNDINLITPYWLASSIAFIFCILFIFSQLAENRKRKEYELNRKQLILLTDDFNLDSISSIGTASSIANSRVKNFLEKLFFTDKNYNGIYLRYIIVQIALFFIIFVLNQGYFTVISRFMLTYLTLGPAKLEVETFIIIQTLFWSLFIFGRFFAAYLAFKLDSVKFFFTILIFNLIICSLFLIPFLTRMSIFYWISVSLLGLASNNKIPYICLNFIFRSRSQKKYKETMETINITKL